MIEFGYEALFVREEEVQMRVEVVIESFVEYAMVLLVMVVDLVGPGVETAVVEVVVAAHAQPWGPIDEGNAGVVVAFAGMV